jgi:hypothetical protein
MTRFRQEFELEDGWSREVAPAMEGYKLACCDCGLVHDMDFKVVKVTQHNPDGSWESEELDSAEYRVIFKARRNKRSTAQVRRHKKANGGENV